MKHPTLAASAALTCLLAGGALAQTPILINTPGEEDMSPDLTKADKSLIERAALPKVRKKLAGDACEESFEAAGVVEGAFSKPDAKQRLVFYQFCQTGNGLGWVGLILMENNRVIGNYVADVGWSVGFKVLPDINQNGLNEFALYYSGGMHQGSGGTGVDIDEFGPAGPKGLGWFNAESFTDTGPVLGYRVTVKPGPTPVFYRERYVQNSAGKWRRTGASTPLKLQKAVGEFVPVR